MALGSSAEIPQILLALDQGTVMIKFFRKRKLPERRVFCLKTETFEILQYPMGRGKHTLCEESIDIREIKEIRDGIGSKDFERQPEELRKIDQFCCFVIYHGCDFKLKTLSVAALCRDECDAWLKALRHITHSVNFCSHMLTHRWLNKEFRSLDTNNTNSINANDLRKFLTKINNKTLQGRFRQVFQVLTCTYHSTSLCTSQGTNM
jgi:phosphatidylinositol phospholipase C gamma-1